MAHTPGPWKFFIRAERSHTSWVLMQRETRQHLFYVNEAPGMGDDGNPNMSLLESAPDLLAACQAMVEANTSYFKDFEQLHPSIANPLKQARAAILKATR